MRGAPVIGALLLPLRRWPVWLAGLACAGWAPGAAAQDCVDTQANCDVLLRAGYQCSSRFGGGLVSDQCQATCDSCASQTQAPPGPPSGPPSGPSAQQQAWTETTIPLDRAPAAEDGATFGQVFVNLDIGTPAQSVRLMIDTSSGHVIVPLDRSVCGTERNRDGSRGDCNFNTQRQAYYPARSNTGVGVECHDADCVGPYGISSEAAAVPMICPLQNSAGEDICPRDGGGGQTGRGNCVLDDSASQNVGQAELCVDHLNPPCADVIAYLETNGLATSPATADGGSCSFDIGALDPSQAGHPLSEFCPETCNMCGSGPVRFCQNNADWKDDRGRGCSEYTRSRALQQACFTTVAYTACPEACNACGDCCTDIWRSEETAKCFFFVTIKSGLGSSLTGGKYKDTVTLQPGPTQRGQRTPPVLIPDAMLGVFNFAEGDFSPNNFVDGAIGLSPAGRACTPSCYNTIWMDLFKTVQRTNPQARDMFALCLAGPIPSWDIGGVRQGHFADVNMDGESSHDDIRYMPLLPVDPEHTELLEWKVAGPSMLRVGNFELDLTQQQMQSHDIFFDLAASKILLPREIYIQWRYTFLVNYAVLNADGPAEEQIAGFDMMNTTHGCAGPVDSTYDPDDELPSFWITVEDVDGHSFDIIIDARHWAVLRTSVPDKPRPPRGQAYICMAVGVSTTDDIVLGSVLMREYYTVFDRGNARVGLALADDCSIGTGYTVGGRGTPALTDACSDCIYPPPPPPPGDGYCSSNPCMNEARCISISGSRYVDGQRVSNTFLCTCVNGYTGRFCELEPEVDDCGSRPCQNGGRCVDGDDAFTCTCRSGFGGEDCSTAPTPCDNGQPCGPGICHDWTRFASMLGYSYSCRCPEGSSGMGNGGQQLMMMGYPNGYADCNGDVNECAECRGSGRNCPCQNGGTCYESSNTRAMRVQVPLGEFQCDCPWPYSGPGCEVNGAPSRKPRDDNSNDPLWNRNGNCMDWFNDPTFGSELTEACCEDPHDCETGVPESCSAECGNKWMPYWKACKGYIEEQFPASMGRKRQMNGGVTMFSDFADMCTETMYGSLYRCTDDYNNQALQALQGSCRGMRASSRSVSFPNTCQDSCVGPFMEYYSACKLKAQEHHIDPDALDAFASKCQDTVKKYPQGAGH